MSTVSTVESEVRVEPAEVETIRAGRGRFGLAPAASRKVGGALAVLGALSVAVALVVPRLGAGVAGGPGPEPELTSAVNAWTVQTNGPVELSLQTSTYGPGESSGWHSHPGLHMVTVVSGELTVFGPDCQAERFGPGQPYIGGDDLHVARNETNEPLEMVVTYVARAGQSMQHFRINGVAPADCAIS